MYKYFIHTIIFSCDVGVLKPDIYDIGLKKMGVEAENVVFLVMEVQGNNKVIIPDVCSQRRRFLYFLYLRRLNMKEKSKIKIFLIVTFILMYVSSIAGILLMEFGNLPFANLLIQVLYIIAGGSPTIAAFFIVFRCYSQKKKNSFISRLLLLKVPAFWWVYAIGLPLLLRFFLDFVYYQDMSHISFSFNRWLELPLVLLSGIFAGGLEEIGWRGILFNELKSKFSIINITIITGLIWGVWYLPLFFIEGLSFSNYEFLPYLLSTIMFSGFLNYLILKTRSIALAVIMHGSINSAGSFGLRLPMVHDLWVYIAMVLLIIVSFYGSSP